MVPSLYLSILLLLFVSQVGMVLDDAHAAGMVDTVTVSLSSSNPASTVESATLFDEVVHPWTEFLPAVVKVVIEFVFLVGEVENLLTGFHPVVTGCLHATAEQ